MRAKLEVVNNVPKILNSWGPSWRLSSTNWRSSESSRISISDITNRRCFLKMRYGYSMCQSVSTHVFCLTVKKKKKQVSKLVLVWPFSQASRTEFLKVFRPQVQSPGDIKNDIIITGDRHSGIGAIWEKHQNIVKWCKMSLRLFKNTKNFTIWNMCINHNKKRRTHSKTTAFWASERQRSRASAREFIKGTVVIIGATAVQIDLGFSATAHLGEKCVYISGGKWRECTQCTQLTCFWVASVQS